MSSKDGCVTSGGRANVLIGPTPRYLPGATCKSGFTYTLSAGVLASDTSATVTSSEDFTTVNKATKLMNIAFCPEKGNVLLVYDKQVTAGPPITLDSFDFVPLTRKVDGLSGGEDKAIVAMDAGDTIVFFAYMYDFNAFGTGLYGAFDSLDNVTLSFETTTSDRMTNKRGKVDEIIDAELQNFTCKFPLITTAEDMKEVLAISGLGSNPMILGNAALANERYQAVCNQLLGRKTQRASVLIIPIENELNLDNRNADDNVKLFQTHWIPFCTLKKAGTHESGVGTQNGLMVEGSALFHPIVQCASIVDPFNWTGEHYVTDTP